MQTSAEDNVPGGKFELYWIKFIHQRECDIYLQYILKGERGSEGERRSKRQKQSGIFPLATVKVCEWLQGKSFETLRRSLNLNLNVLIIIT
jgi:hypothetical protein